MLFCASPGVVDWSSCGSPVDSRLFKQIGLYFGDPKFGISFTYFGGATRQPKWTSFLGAWSEFYHTWLAIGMESARLKVDRHHPFTPFWGVIGDAPVRANQVE